MSRLFTLFFILIFAFSSCTKEDENPIPNSRVYFLIDLLGFEGDGILNGNNSWKIFNINNTKGRPYFSTYSFGFSGQILVVRDMNGEFHALDMACPHEVDRTVVLRISKEKNTIICDKCKSEFELIESGRIGAKNSGPSGFNMTNHYLVEFISGSRYQVINPYAY